MQVWENSVQPPRPPPGAVALAPKALQLGETYPFSARDSLGGSKVPLAESLATGTTPSSATNLGKSLQRLVIPMVTQEQTSSLNHHFTVRFKCTLA